MSTRDERRENAQPSPPTVTVAAAADRVAAGQRDAWANDLWSASGAWGVTALPAPWKARVGGFAKLLSGNCRVGGRALDRWPAPMGRLVVGRFHRAAASHEAAAPS